MLENSSTRNFWPLYVSTTVALDVLAQSRLGDHLDTVVHLDTQSQVWGFATGADGIRRSMLLVTYRHK
jgi:hypothetical protein